MKIDIIVLVWEKVEDSKKSVLGIIKEKEYLKKKGYDVRVIVVDNGSRKELKDWLKNLYWEEKKIDIFFSLQKNCGISKARNKMLNHTEGKYVIMIDGDITPVYKSFNAMIEYVENHPNDKVGCIGAASYQYSLDEKGASIELEHILNVDEGKQVGGASGQPIAWTQYGIFLGSMFDDLRFVEEGVFGLPGYGYEDDLLAVSIINRGYRILRFTDIHYYHSLDPSMTHGGALKLEERRIDERKSLALKIIEEGRTP